MSKKYIVVLMLLMVILSVSSYFIYKEFAENKKENDIYEELQEIVEITDNSTKNYNKEENIKKESNYNLESIKKINNDVIGWLKIDDTNINYPVMQNGNFYLHRNIYKNYSSCGTPYLASDCKLNNSDNLIIYGHHMKNNTMFSSLENYKNYSFYKNHKTIKFYVLKNEKTKEQQYEIVYVFKTTVYSDEGFKYYKYTKFEDVEEYKDFVGNCEKLKFYNTDIKAKYTDKFITLSTCEYSQKNGRLVIVAKKI